MRKTIFLVVSLLLLNLLVTAQNVGVGTVTPDLASLVTEESILMCSVEVSRLVT